MEATGQPHFRDEVQVPAVLGRLTLPPAEPSNEVKEAARKDEETAAVGRPSETANNRQSRVRTSGNASGDKAPQRARGRRDQGKTRVSTPARLSSREGRTAALPSLTFGDDVAVCLFSKT